MCATCGCGDSDHEHDHDHEHEHEHADGHSHGHHHRSAEEGRARRLRLETEVLAKNDALAQRNRTWLAHRSITALNVTSSPGSGKTTLLEETIRRLSPRRTIAVIEGDQETDNDARRIRATGAAVVQINTGTGCHLDAAMIARALSTLAPPAHSLLFIENVGNLVCPALFDLGEAAKVVVASVTEGDDKPLKYPHMFRASQALVINKVDLAPHVAFDADRFVGNARRVNPRLDAVFVVSATRGDGMDAWCAWLERALVDGGLSPTGART